MDSFLFYNSINDYIASLPVFLNCKDELLNSLVFNKLTNSNQYNEKELIIYYS